jgi:hypothetical protein
MEPDRSTSEPTDRGKRGFRVIAVVFAGILVALLLGGIWATSEMDRDFNPPPTTTMPK